MMSKQQLIQKNSRAIGIPCESYMKILQATFSARGADIKDLEKCLVMENFIEMQTIAHRLKGVFGNLRLDELVKLIERIDDLARTQGDLREIRKLLMQFKNAFEDLKMQFN